MFYSTGTISFEHCVTIRLNTLINRDLNKTSVLHNSEVLDRISGFL